MKYIKTFESFKDIKKLFGFDSDESSEDVYVAEKDIRFGEKSDAVKKLQQSLEKLGFKLYSYGTDSIIGSETMGQLKSLFTFLKKPEFSDYVEDEDLLVIKNKTVTTEQQELVYDLANDEKLKNKISNYFKDEEKKIEKMGLSGNRKLFRHVEDPKNFVVKLNQICKKLQIENVNWMLLVMYKESKINPKAVNKKSNATGLIQFMPSTAKHLNTTVSEIYDMTAIEQLDLVYEYYKRFTGKLHNAQDVYAVTFFPIAVGKDEDWVLKAKNLSAEKIASQNPVIDLNKDGEITRGEFDEYATKDVPSEIKSKI